MYSKLRHRPHPRGFLCAKFGFFCGLHCWASPWKKSHTHSLSQSLTQSPSLFDALEPKRLCFRIYQPRWLIGQLCIWRTISHQNSICECNLQLFPLVPSKAQFQQPTKVSMDTFSITPTNQSVREKWSHASSCLDPCFVCYVFGCFGITINEIAESAGKFASQSSLTWANLFLSVQNFL